MVREITAAMIMVPDRIWKTYSSPQTSAMSPPRIGTAIANKDCVPNNRLTIDPPSCGGVISNAQLCKTGRTAKINTPDKPTTTRRIGNDSIHGKVNMMMAEPMKPIIRMGRRPIRSERIPAKGVVTAPVACETITRTPSQNGSESKAVTKYNGKKVRSPTWEVPRKPDMMQTFQVFA